MRNFIEIVFSNATNETVRFHVFFDRFELITKLSESVNNQTLNDGQKDNNNEEEESNVENDSIDFVVVSIGISNFVTDTTSSSYALIKMEHETCEHVVTLFVDFILLFLDVKFTEEIKGNNGVDVDDNCEQHDSQHKLLAVVCYWLQNSSQCLETNSNIE